MITGGFSDTKRVREPGGGGEEERKTRSYSLEKEAENRRRWQVGITKATILQVRPSFYARTKAEQMVKWRRVHVGTSKETEQPCARAEGEGVITKSQ